jgi:hypothetical protein
MIFGKLAQYFLDVPRYFGEDSLIFRKLPQYFLEPPQYFLELPQYSLEASMIFGRV